MADLKLSMKKDRFVVRSPRELMVINAGVKLLLQSRKMNMRDSMAAIVLYNKIKVAVKKEVQHA